MKKIAFFTQNLDVGGVQKSVSTLANYLSQFYEVCIILAEDNKKIKYPLNTKISIYKIPTTKINLHEIGIGKTIFEYRIKELEKILLFLNTELTISYEDYNNLILLNTKSICKKLISCRVSLQDSYTPNSFIHLLNASFYFEMIKQYYPQADEIICVSKAIKKELQALTAMEKICVIYNGITKNTEIKETVPLNNFILNVGRLHKQKGQKDFIKAFNLIKNKTTHSLVIVGDGELLSELETLREKLHLSKRVHFTGFQDPYPYIKQSSLFVFPSYYEGFSNSILEVMSMSKAIVAYSYEGADEILPSQALVEKGNIQSLADSILNLLQNEEQREALEQSLFKISQHFSLDKSLASFHQKSEQHLI